ncbi:30S ribosome-binding factor RbfA [Pantoea sp. Mhis]|uniref:30S ribosome-binding factor RbfA n=1 Tax=Pantoea sp. Mhis TaxID=2576759 RepID=UPI0013599AA1|nr:30S ribosome-binding factor RbfA [Pantoea sp. Mhis]MXP56448.1 30S ribosome-binding factor RbfA [Pantoea sp. Mhis]
MIKEFSRSKRIAQQLKKNISIILQRNIQDPRLEIMITVSAVEVSSDLAYAKVFVTFLNNKDKELIKNILKILQNASGYIRNLLSGLMYLYIVPKLTFFYDSSLDEGIRISDLIFNTLKNDIKLQAKNLCVTDDKE